MVGEKIGVLPSPIGSVDVQLLVPADFLHNIAACNFFGPVLIKTDVGSLFFTIEVL